MACELNKYQFLQKYNTLTQTQKGDLIQVYRITPSVEDYYYLHAESTILYRDEKYTEFHFADINTINAVGKFVEHKVTGYMDNATHISTFEDTDGKITKVDYSYGGHTCFIQFDARLMRIYRDWRLLMMIQKTNKIDERELTRVANHPKRIRYKIECSNDEDFEMIV
jgi:hypothetical protein